MIKTARPADLNLSRQRLFNIRQNITHGDFPKEETMREQLRLAKWKCVATELWFAE